MNKNLSVKNIPRSHTRSRVNFVNINIDINKYKYGLYLEYAMYNVSVEVLLTGDIDNIVSILQNAEHSRYPFRRPTLME